MMRIPRFPAILAAAAAAVTPAASARTGQATLSTGIFTMGDAAGLGLQRERPPHKLRISAYRIDCHEVTVGEYVAFLNNAIAQDAAQVRHGRVLGKPVDMPWCETSESSEESRIVYHAATPEPFSVVQPPEGTPGSFDDHPMTCVSWFGAAAYAAHHGCRLPTEAEWERAARAGAQGSAFPCGVKVQASTDLPGDRANFRGSGDQFEDAPSPCTTPVGSYKANSIGIHDLTGNAAEWCMDWYADGYYSAHPPGHWPPDPTGPRQTTGLRVIRGGAWNYEPFFCRCAARAGLAPHQTSASVGFRTVIPLSP